MRIDDRSFLPSELERLGLPARMRLAVAHDESGRRRAAISSRERSPSAPSDAIAFAARKIEPGLAARRAAILRRTRHLARASARLDPSLDVGLVPCDTTGREANRRRELAATASAPDRVVTQAETPEHFGIADQVHVGRAVMEGRGCPRASRRAIRASSGAKAARLPNRSQVRELLCACGETRSRLTTTNSNSMHSAATCRFALLASHVPSLIRLES